MFSQFIIVITGHNNYRLIFNKYQVPEVFCKIKHLYFYQLNEVWVSCMQLNEAVSKRILELCKSQGLTQYALSQKSGVPQSTLSTIINCTFPSMKLRVIYEICEGFEMSLEDFFASPLFARDNIID